MPHARRSVITGLGVVSPVGLDVATSWDSLVEGRSGVGAITAFDADRFSTRIAGEVKNLLLEDHFSTKEIRHRDRFIHLGLVAARQALQDSGLDVGAINPDRVGVIAASGVGGLGTIESQAIVLHERGPRKMSPFCIPQMIIDMLSGAIAIEYGFKGPNFGYVSACSSAAHSIGEATRMIRLNEADILIAGGSEAPITPLGVGGFSAMKALSTRNDDPSAASRPFDMERDGFVIAEGAGIVVIEEYEHARARGATMYAEVSGYGRTCDAYHITAPDQDGSGGSKAMILALEDAGLGPHEVDYINAHGTSTGLNDRCETLAIKAALGQTHACRVPVSSTKSMTGHLLGAAGGIETVASVLAIKEGILPPTINLETPDPECDLDYIPNAARKAAVGTVLSNSLGFGGHNATLCFRGL